MYIWRITVTKLSYLIYHKSSVASGSILVFMVLHMHKVVLMNEVDY